MKGKITFDVTPTADTDTECTSTKSWKFVLAINSAFKGGVDVKESDYDGDGFTNGKEKKAKTDPWDPDDKPTP